MEKTQQLEILDDLNRRTGFETPPTITEIHRGMIKKFCVAVGETNPLYLNEDYARSTRFGGIVAPPTFVAAFTDTHFPEVVVQDLPFSTMLHSDDDVVLERLIRPGDVITAIARYAGAYIREHPRGPRLYQQADLILTDSSRERIANVRIVTINF